MLMFLRRKEGPGQPEGTVAKKQPKLVLREKMFLRRKEGPGLPEGTVSKKQPGLF
jgi:hypothetical protein